jgi:hypothetical protein
VREKRPSVEDLDVRPIVPSGVSIKVLVSDPRTAPLGVFHRQFFVMAGANVRTTNTALQPKVDRSRNFRRLLFQATQQPAPAFERILLQPDDRSRTRLK